MICSIKIYKYFLSQHYSLVIDVGGVPIVLIPITKDERTLKHGRFEKYSEKLLRHSVNVKSGFKISGYDFVKWFNDIILWINRHKIIWNLMVEYCENDGVLICHFSFDTLENSVLFKLMIE